MKQKLFLFCLALLCSANMLAHDFEVDGIYYNKLGGDSVEVTRDGNYSMNGLNVIIIPESVVYNDTTYRVTSLSDYAFDYGYGDITSITFGKNIKKIGQKAFGYNTKLTSTTYNGDVADWCAIEFVSIESNPLQYSEHFYIKSQEVKELVIPDSVHNISAYAFYECDSLKSVNISCGAIELSAFNGCENLTSVTLGDKVTSIGHLAFASTSITSLQLPNSLVDIGYNAFQYCQALASVDWGNGLKHIGNEAFTESGVAGDIIFPSSLISIGEMAFYNCNKITSVVIPDNVLSIGESAFYTCSKLTSVNIGNGLTNIEGGVFGECFKLTNVTIGTGITSIGEYAFYGAALTSVTIPNNVISIEREAFSTCTNLTTVTMSENILNIGKGVFAECSNLQYNTYNKGRYLGNSNNKYQALLQVTDTTITSLSVPNQTTAIADDVYIQCTRIPYKQYDNALYLGTTQNPYMRLVKAVNKEITSCNIHEDTKIIADTAFRACSYLKSITIPNNVVSIEESAFQDCDSLISVILNNNLLSIGYKAFNNCSSLTSIHIPDNVTNIYDRTFYSCDKLSSIHFGKSVREIGASAFRDCAITKINIPDNIKIIREEAFYRCNSIISITVDAVQPPLAVDKSCFSTNIYETAKLIVPCGMTENYRTSNQCWKYFADIRGNLDYNVSISTNDVEGGKVEILQKPSCDNNGVAIIQAIPNDDYKFSQWSDGNTDNPRTFKVTQDTTLTPIFVKDSIIIISYTVTTNTNNPDYGTVTGGGVYQPDTTILVTAVPNNGYQFLYWEDSSVENPRSITVTQDTVLTATFGETDKVTILTNTNPIEGGTIMGAGTYELNTEVTLTAKANGGYAFVDWSDGNTDNPRTIITAENMMLTANFTEKHYEYVDLGLPSGLLWATCNVGAETPEETGDYFAWGETEPKEIYNWSTYKWCDGTYNSLTKYCSDSYYGKDGFVDNKTVLDPEDDAATVNWGKNWRTPTYEEYKELLDNCTCTWTYSYGMPGYELIASNGNSIFLPQVKSLSTSNYYQDYCWTATNLGGDASAVYLHEYNGEYLITISMYRSKGLPVRAVTESVKYTINAISSDTTQGTVIGSGIYPMNREMTLKAVPKSGYKFTSWSDGNTDNPRTITVTEDITLTASFMEMQHEYIDLGLSSGVFWATYNVGAETPEETGDYFAWGETEPKESYSWETYKWCEGTYNSLTKYCSDYQYGSSAFTDYKTILDSEDDAAAFNWGKNWRMPLKEEAMELVEECTWIDTTSNGVKGYQIVGPNGKSIFLPAVGYKQNNIFNSTSISYLTATANSSTSVWMLGTKDVFSNVRIRGSLVRAVITPIKYTITAVSSDTTLGTVIGSGVYPIDREITLTAHANKRYKFISWSDGNTENPRVVTVTEDKTYMAYFVEKTFDYVDLALPSGMLWATCNVGAEVPEETGDYFAWGEVDTKDYYHHNTYIWNQSGWQAKFTKYCSETSAGSNGFVDYKTSLDPEDDAVIINNGGMWRMPNAEELQELIEMCTWIPTIQNEVTGYEVVGTNGNTIFLPTTGYKLSEELNDSNICYYWTSNLPEGGSYWAYALKDNEKTTEERRYGLPIRGVMQGYIISVACNETQGYVTGAGTYAKDEIVAITASPADGYKFISWSDGNTDNPRTIAITKNETYIAMFEKNLTLDVNTISSNISTSVHKVFENGTIYIVKPNGEKYTILGRKLQ